ncbi:MAG: VWA domain-containing protein [Ardenticatenales bacterium]|nr:VWA domain-containing protein [Ardenticatenales bacterium]
MNRRHPTRSAVRLAWCRSLALGATFLVGALLSVVPAAAQPGTVPPAPGTTALTYSLSATWQDVSYSGPTETGPAALFYAPIDISAAPDGRIYVLDMANVQPDPANGGESSSPVVHVLWPNGVPPTRLLLTTPNRNAIRLDAAPDGGVAVLAQLNDGNNAAVLRYDAAGRLVRDFPVSDNARDVAVAPDGRIVVADARRLRWYGADGKETNVVDPSIALPTPSAPPGGVWTAQLVNIDVAADGRVYIHQVAECTCQVTPDPRPTATPTPTPTPRPRLAALDTVAEGQGSTIEATTTLVEARRVEVCRADAAGPAGTLGVAASAVVDRRHEVLVLAPDGGAERKGRPGAWIMDVAAGASEGYISTVETTYRPVFAVSTYGPGALPVASIPLQRSLGPDVFASVPAAMPVRLAMAYSGRILAAWPGTDHFYHGAADLGLPSSTPMTSPWPPGRPRPVALGVHAEPLPYGPRRPAAVTVAGDEIVVYEAPYRAYNDESGVRTAVDARRAVGGLQRYASDGRFVDSWTHFGSHAHVRGQLDWSPYGVPVDIGGTDDAVYTITPGAVWRRVDRLAPDWVIRMNDAQLVAGDADADHVAVLDAADGSVRVFASDGAATAHWPVNGPGLPPCAPADIALSGARVFLADQGRNRILVRDLDGAPVGEFGTHDGPLRIDATPDGDVVVLGRGGWGLRYSAAGALLAAWRMPGATAVKPALGNDITADADGKVYVTWLGATRPTADDRSRRGDRIEQAGVWVFVPTAADRAPAEPNVRACLVQVNKKAAPEAVRLGEEITVRLEVSADCPKEPLPQQIMIVLDTSWSMNDGYQSWTEPPSALDRARTIVLPLLASLSPDVVDVGLVTFGDGAALETVLSDDLPDMRTRIVRAVADGDTRMGAGIDLARQELLGPRRAVDARPSILIVSDGVFKDDPAPAIAAAHAAGIAVYALVMSTPEFTADYRQSLVTLLGDPNRLFVDPSLDTAHDLIDALRVYRDETRQFASLTVTDEVPANLRYVPDSAVPSAVWDAAARTLTWQLGPQPPGAPVTLSFRAVPLEVGEHPTNVKADVTWLDGRGASGRLAFPVPRVRVTPGRIYLPFAVRQQCTAWSRPLDLVLVHDISSSMAEPSADGVRTKLEVAAEAALIFLERMNPARDRIGVVAFDAEATVVAPLSNDRRTAVAALASMRPGYGTRIDRGLQAAIDIVAGDPRALALPVIVLLSDGLQNGPADPVRALLPQLRDTGARVFVVGYGGTGGTGGGAGGNAEAEALLREIATAPTDYRFAPAVEDLRAVYDGVGRTLLCP